MLLDIRQLTLDDLKSWFSAQGEQPFRAKQVYEWLWQKGAHAFNEMTNLSLPLREKLGQHFEIKAIMHDLSQHSEDGTIKSRYRLHDGFLIETVLIPVAEEQRFTVCVSSQVGCSLTCSFCATGKMKRERNLEAAEIFDQFLMVNRKCEEVYGHPITNIVFMGMGEPLLAYRPVMEAIERITSPSGLNVSPRRITVSTAGIAKMIRKLADDKVRFNLALSLHAADDKKRNEIMPINETNNLDELVAALQYFQEQTHPDIKLTFEYIALDGFNDKREDAQNLVALARQLRDVHVNVIEYNPVDGVEFSKSSGNAINAFAEHLRQHGVGCTVRRSRGKDIDAACGQLANK